MRTSLEVRQQVGGMFVAEDDGKSTGQRWYVDSATGTDSAGYGQNPDAPVATIDYAWGLCTANKNDIIYVMPGHAETINTAGGITCDKAGVTLIGLGNGEDRPTITVGSSLDTATILVSAADVTLKNLIVVPGNDGVDVLIDVNADGFTIEKCWLRSDETNGYQADTYIDVNGGGANAADRCTVRNCKITSESAGAAQGIEVGAVEDALVVEDCWIDGDFTAAGIHSASAFTSALIKGNVISNRNTGNHAIELSAAATGMLVDNRMYGDTLGTILDPGSMKCLGNLETDAIDQAGVDSPRTSAGGLADGSITAAVIANGAIDAATFAAGAIDATAIANDAIDATAIANDAIDYATLAADAKLGVKLGVGVEKATVTLGAGDSNLFTVAGGKVAIHGIIGIVTTVVQGQATVTKLTFTSTGTTDTSDLCATLDLTAAKQGALLGIYGLATTALTLGVAPMCTQPMVVDAGTIKCNNGSGANTGVITWTCYYTPITVGATVAAA